MIFITRTEEESYGSVLCNVEKIAAGLIFDKYCLEILENAKGHSACACLGDSKSSSSVVSPCFKTRREVIVWVHKNKEHYKKLVKKGEFIKFWVEK